jgi:hypothetical protein
MGGTIRLITNQPRLGDLEMTGQAIASYTQHGGANVGGNAMLNIPIGSKVALRTTISLKEYDGFIDVNVLRPFPIPTNEVRGDVLSAPVVEKHNNVNNLHQIGIRGQLLLEPSDQTSILLSAFVQRLKQDGADTYDSPPNRLAHYAPFYVPEPYRDNFQIYSATID